MSIDARIRDILETASNYAAGGMHMKLRHIELFLEGDEPTIANVLANVTIKYEKGNNSRQNIVTARHGLFASGGTLEEVLTAAKRRLDRRLLSKDGILPFCPQISKRMLDLQKAASTQQARKQSRQWAIKLDILLVFTHDVRRGTSKDLAKLPRGVMKTHNSGVARAMGHNNKSMSKFYNGDEDEALNIYKAGNEVTEIDTRILQAPVGYKRPNQLEVRKLIDDYIIANPGKLPGNQNDAQLFIEPVPQKDHPRSKEYKRKAGIAATSAPHIVEPDPFADALAATVQEKARLTGGALNPENSIAHLVDQQQHRQMQTPQAVHTIDTSLQSLDPRLFDPTPLDPRLLDPGLDIPSASSDLLTGRQTEWLEGNLIATDEDEDEDEIISNTDTNTDGIPDPIDAPQQFQRPDDENAGHTLHLPPPDFDTSASTILSCFLAGMLSWKAMSQPATLETNRPRSDSLVQIVQVNRSRISSSFVVIARDV
ncbi:uncharacterized protein PV07_08548 [Cladophialophora immunda]|uniref:Uncharacterized protein n=1 Tax=Cladophialophora immunda TaxID=569365 RepID=A0A0D2CP78_9EURO|nr:uncharacterized protein PV07_08548 [Cladophialophora immunda]KIW25364.1 hypothetical protein PV07_08548 [Cladophialophora immunda]